jgi:hypothetical protein
LRAVKKLAQKGALPYHVVSDLSERRQHLHVTLPAHSNNKETHMLWTIFVILLVLWLLGLVTSYTFGGYIHLLLLIALVVVVIRLIQGRSPV